ncbi:MAG TPA: hypothetical protein VJB67_00930, partial [Patescibacteria group bacterium]|nr:hypothetical protein [Patescibacteria group bacterium]
NISLARLTEEQLNYLANGSAKDGVIISAGLLNRKKINGDFCVFHRIRQSVRRGWWQKVLE